MKRKALRESFLPVPISLFTNGKLASLQMKGGMEYVGLYLWLSYFFGIAECDGLEGMIEVGMIDSVAFQAHSDTKTVYAFIEDCKKIGLISVWSNENGLDYILSPYWREAVLIKKRISESRRDAVNSRYRESDQVDTNCLEDTCFDEEKVISAYSEWLKEHNLSKSFYSDVMESAKNLGINQDSAVRFMCRIMEENLTFKNVDGLARSLVAFDLDLRGKS